MQARQQQLLIDVEVRETRRLLLRALRRRRGAEADAFLDGEFLAVADRPAIMHAILVAAVTAGGADASDLQRHDLQTATLRMEAQRGLSDDFAAFFASAGPARQTASTAAVISREAVIVDDIDHSPVYRGRRVLDAMRAAGFRAVHSYPLPDTDGEVRGVLSLYYWRRYAAEAYPASSRRPPPRRPADRIIWSNPTGCDGPDGVPARVAGAGLAGLPPGRSSTRPAAAAARAASEAE
jgi:hypothetical protein